MDRSASFLIGAAAGAVLLAANAPSSINNAPAPNGATNIAQTSSTSQAVRKSPIPDTFTNLKVLPSNIEKGDLVAVMKAMSVGLKVRCSHCHVATDDLSEADFASDEKPTKVFSREMLRVLFETRAKYAVGESPAASSNTKR